MQVRLRPVRKLRFARQQTDTRVQALHGAVQFGASTHMPAPCRPAKVAHQIQGNALADLPSLARSCACRLRAGPPARWRDAHGIAYPHSPGKRGAGDDEASPAR